MTQAEMRQHVLDLAAHHRVGVEIYEGGGCAWTQSRFIKIRDVRGVVTYFTALHELGHIVGPGRSARKLEKEANAWLWAIRAAGRKPTPSVMKAIRRSLHSYLMAGRRSYGLRQNMVEPPEDHPFWALLDGRVPPYECPRCGETQTMVKVTVHVLSGRGPDQERECMVCDHVWPHEGAIR